MYSHTHSVGFFIFDFKISTLLNDLNYFVDIYMNEGNVLVEI